MKRKFYLPGLNSKSTNRFEKDENIESLISSIDKSVYPLIYSFVKETNKFYQENFNELDSLKLREKRLLDFETPNRAKIVHELDIELTNDFDYNKFYYLFNPFNRLSWLKINQENKRLIVANNEKVEGFVRKLVSQEIKDLTNGTVVSDDTFFNYLWKHKLGYPCFVKLNNIGSKNFILKAEYFDSIKVDKSKKYFSSNLFFPLAERTINYEYFPLKKRSSWLYLKAPKNFNISIENIVYSKRVNIVDNYNSEDTLKQLNSDPEINTMTIVNTGEAPGEDINVYFDINIIIPESLKIWFLTIYYSSLALLGLLLFSLMNDVYFYFELPVLIRSNPIESLFKSGNLNSIILTIVAGIIATRGWLISEETILKQYSKYLTVIMLLLLLIPALNYLFGFLV